MIESKWLKQISLLLVVVGIGYVLMSNLVFMSDSILGAIMLFILSRKPIYFLVKRKIKRTTAQWLFFIAVIILILIPILTVIIVIEQNIGSFVNTAMSYKDSIALLGDKILERTGINVFSQDTIKSMGIKITQWIPKLLNSSLDLLTSMGVMFFLLYFLISDGKKIQQGIINMMPLNRENQSQLIKLMYSSILTNAIMVPLVAMIQALVAWISYGIAGVPNSFVWFLATFLSSMLPFIGGALIYIPLAAITFFSGHQGAGIFILVWGIVVVSASDNFLRMFMMKKFDDTHPLITFFGVIIGLNIFGFLGLIYGPLLISMFFILVKMYKAEYPKS